MPAGDPRSGGLGLLSAKLLHSAGKYKVFVILIKKKSSFTITLNVTKFGIMNGISTRDCL